MPPLTIQQTFDLAVRHHQSGRLNEAEPLYRQILARQPRHADALHMLGVIAYQVRRYDVAVDLLRQAIAIVPNWPEAHYNLGNALQEHGQWDAAVAAFRQAVALKPGFADAHNNLGNALRAKGNLDESIAAYRRALALQPNFPAAHNNLGDALKAKGQMDAAIAAYRLAIVFKPDFVEAHSNLANALLETGSLPEAVAAGRQAAALRPDLPEAHYNLAVMLQTNGQWDEAIAAYRQAIALKPNHPEAYNNLGVILKNQGRLDDAIAAFHQFQTLAPNHAQAPYNLGTTLQARGRMDQAIVAYRQALALRPNFPEAYNNLGYSLTEIGQPIEAVAACRQAIALNPHPENSEAFTNLLFALHYCPDCDPRQILEEARRWASLQPVFTPGYFPSRDQQPDRKLKIGYLSPFFIGNVEAHFTFPLLSHHDRRQFEIFAYSQAAHPDPFSQRLAGLCDHWFDIHPLGIRETVELLRRHELDIIVNISSPADKCLAILANRVAPIQVIWLIFASCTSGLPTMDYRLSDPYVDPVGMDETCYCEQTLRLPETAWCYDPLIDALPVELLPATRNGFLTFGSLNRSNKISALAVAAWAQILRALPGSRLRILAVAGNARQELLAQFQPAGVESGRIDFIDRAPRADYLQQFHRIDIMLDTFPYGGHTTALDSLWMGVPVITCTGRTTVGRVTAAALQILGLGEFVAHTPEEYVRCAVQLANDLPRLTQLRRTLGQSIAQSPLMNAPRFVGNIESAYRQMWRRYCATTTTGGL